MIGALGLLQHAAVELDPAQIAADVVQVLIKRGIAAGAYCIANNDLANTIAFSRALGCRHCQYFRSGMLRVNHPVFSSGGLFNACNFCQVFPSVNAIAAAALPNNADAIAAHRVNRL